MSADRWSVCPVCDAKHTADREKAIRAAEDSYGKVPVDDFIAARDAAEAITAHPRETMREDWESWWEGDMLVYSHGACCEVCGAGFSFKGPIGPVRGAA